MVSLSLEKGVDKNTIIFAMFIQIVVKMRNSYVKVFFIANILIGAGLVIYEQSFGTGKNPYLQIVGFVMLMLGLYGVSRNFVNSDRKLYKEGDFEEIPFDKKEKEEEDA